MHGCMHATDATTPAELNPTIGRRDFERNKHTREMGEGRAKDKEGLEDLGGAGGAASGGGGRLLS